MKKKIYLFHALVLPVILISQLSSQFVLAEEMTTTQTTEVTTTLVTPLLTTEVQVSSTQEIQTEATTEPSTTPATTEEELVAETESASGSVPIYRLYNPGLGKHLYTTDANEKKVLYEQHGWGYEGVGWYAPKSGKAVYRLYNPILKNHLYTTDTNEVKVLTSRHGWQSDNQGKAVFYSGGQVNIYRLYNVGLNGRHHWTTDTNEYKVLPSHGWSQEGVKFSAVQIGKPIQTQFYGVYPNSNLKYADATSLAYERLLEEYYFYSNMYDNNAPSSVYNTLSFVMLNNMHEVYYSYMDLDRNGTKELILRRWMSGGSQYDIYTYSGGKVVFLTYALNHYEGGVSEVYTDGTLHGAAWPGPGSPLQHSYYRVSGNRLVTVGSNVKGKKLISEQLSWNRLRDGYKAAGYRKVNLSGNSWVSSSDAMNFVENFYIKNYGKINGSYSRKCWTVVSNSENTIVLHWTNISGHGGSYVKLVKYPTYVAITDYIYNASYPNNPYQTVRVSRNDFSIMK